MNEKLPWTMPEMDLLRNMMAGGATAAEVARTVGRTVEAVRTKWLYIRQKQTDSRPEEIFHQRWMLAYGNRAYPRYKVDQADAPVFVRNYGVNGMTTGGVAVYG